MYITQIPILKTTNLFTIDDNHQPTFVHADHPNYQQPLLKKLSILSSPFLGYQQCSQNQN